MSAHIILCSKNPALLAAATRTFDQSRSRLTVCESGLEVLGAVEVVDADLLILDMEIPGLNGLLIVTAVRELAPDLPIVAVSTTPQDDARAVCHKGVSYATLPSGPNGGAEVLLGALAEVASLSSKAGRPGLLSGVRTM